MTMGPHPDGFTGPGPTVRPYVWRGARVTRPESQVDLAASHGERRRVVVVGGTSGIGAAVAARFASGGAHVVVAGLVSTDELTTPDDRIDVAEVDLREPDRLEKLIGALPSLSVLVNAAGVIRRDEEFAPDIFREVVEINLTGALRASVAAHRLLAASAGCIVNVASMLSYFGGPRVPGYAASKGGIVQLTKSLAVAWAEDGIRVNAVAPGWIRTELTAALRLHPATAEQIVKRTPMGRWGEAAEVAGAVEFLAGPDAAFITGAVLPVDGGYLAA